jgi:hypothetical protein
MNYKINKGHFCHFHCSCVEQVLGISYFVSVNTLALWSLRSLLRLHVYMLVAHCSPTKVTSVDCYATPEIDLETIKKLMFRGPSAKEGPQQVWFLILWGLGLSHIISRSIDRSFFLDGAEIQQKWCQRNRRRAQHSLCFSGMREMETL